MINIENEMACMREYVCASHSEGRPARCVVKIHVADLCKHYTVRIRVQHPICIIQEVRTMLWLEFQQ